MRIRIKMTLRRIWCAIVGHRMWEYTGMTRMHCRDGSRYVDSGYDHAFCARCNKPYIVEDE